MKRHERKYKLTIILSIAALMVGMLVLPAVAAGSGTGAFEFAGLAIPNDGMCSGEDETAGDDGKDGACLPAFPDENGVNGDFDGDITGSASGIDQVNGEDVSWSADFLGRIDADFTYTEDPDECPLTGTANGTFEIDGDAVGVYDDRVVTDFHATGTFDWDRTGTQALINITLDVELTFDDGGPSPILVLDDVIGTATATFEASPNAALCDGSRVTATVIGEGEFSTSTP